MNKFLGEFEEVWVDDDLYDDLYEVDLTGVIFGSNGPEFNVLDRVRVKSVCLLGNNNLCGKEGYVIGYTYSGGFYYLIYFIDSITGHDGMGVDRVSYIPSGNGLWINVNILGRV